MIRGLSSPGAAAALILLLLAFGFRLDCALDSFDEDDPTAPGPASSAAGLLRSFLGNLSYEIRGLLARLLYLKIDRYAHEGRKIQLGDGAVGVTMAANTDIVPLYGLITYLDPHFIEAFSLGGNHLIYGLDKPKEGLELLETGVAWNAADPLCSELLGQIGVHYSVDLLQPARAIPYFKRALELRKKLPDPDAPSGFVFSQGQLVGLLAVNNYRAGNRPAALRWLALPNRLDAGHEIFRLLGVVPPARPAGASPSPPAHEHALHHHTAAEEDRERLGQPDSSRPSQKPWNPRWWEDAEERARFVVSLRNGLLLNLALLLPFWPGLLRRWTGSA
ncbi:MAG: hypothetical protein HY303_17700 [Candidatus Wallbacteria bacterium]|nr:hypothetical protein [Candidatus Wallbacteria bacterium]